MDIRLFLARGKDGILRLYDGVPRKNERSGTFQCALCVMVFYDRYPEITWENSPQEVELKLIKK